MILLALLLAAAPGDARVATGTPSVTLAQLLEAADKNNVDRRMTLEVYERSRAEYRQAWTSLLPSLSVQATWTHNQYEAVLPAGTFGPMSPEVVIQKQDQLDLIARFDLPLIDTTRWMRSAAAGAASDAAAERVQLTSDQVKRGVASVWYQYGAALTSKESALRSLDLAEAQLKLTQIRFDSGAVPELDVMRSRAEVARNQQSVADVTRLIAIARRNLISLTGVDPGDGAVLPETNLTPPETLNSAESRVDQLPAVKAAIQDQRAAEKLALASKLALVPVVGAQFTERVSNSGGFTGESTSYLLGVNLGWRLDVPVFQGMSVAASNVELASLAVEKARLQALDQINTDWQTLTAALTKVTAAKSQVEAATRARAVAATRYEVGATTQIELIQADRDLFGAELQEISARSDLAAARVALALSSAGELVLP